MKDDSRPFPIQQEMATVEGKKVWLPESQIPWWLAEIAYKEYQKQCGNDQTLERLAERHGFGRQELLKLLRKEKVY